MKSINTTLKLMDAASAASEKLEEAGGNLLTLSEPYRTFVAVWTAQGIIDNGGMMNFFEADFPHQPPYAVFVDSYRNIGADRAAICLANAIASFPFENPEQHKDQRNQFMEEYYDEKSGAVSIWDDSLCGDEMIFEKLVAFSESHMDSFFVKTRAPRPWWKRWIT